MSGFIGGALPQFILQTKDQRLGHTFLDVRDTRKRVTERADFSFAGYLNEFWPGNRGFIGDQSTDVSIQEAVWGRRLKRFAIGCASRVGFVGVSFDQFGTPLAGVTCSLFRTSTREWIMDVISGSDGTFFLQSWYSPDTHFIVFNKAGAPDVFGTTRQTLVGA
jgi:hypothetical protein